MRFVPIPATTQTQTQSLFHRQTQQGLRARGACFLSSPSPLWTMAPKRKASTASKAASKKAKDEPASSKKAKAKDELSPPAKTSSSKTKPLTQKSVAEVWNSAEYVEGGKMSQAGFAVFIQELGIEEMSFEAIYLTFRLSASSDAVDDVMTVCASKQSLQGGLDGLGCAPPPRRTRVPTDSRNARTLTEVCMHRPRAPQMSHGRGAASQIAHQVRRHTERLRPALHPLFPLAL